METFQLLNAWKAGLQSSIGNLQLFCLSGSQRRPSQRRPSLTGRMAGLISPGRQSGDSTGRGDVKFTLAQVLEKSDKLVRKKCIKMLQPLAIQLITIMCRYQNMIKYIYIYIHYTYSYLNMYNIYLWYINTKARICNSDFGRATTTSADLTGRGHLQVGCESLHKLSKHFRCVTLDAYPRCIIILDNVL